MLDFELTAINSFGSRFDTTINCCYFHMTQAQWRNLQRLGLSTLYNTDIEFNYNVKLLRALAFVPVDDVHHVYERVIETKYFVENEEILEPYLSYLEKRG